MKKYGIPFFCFSNYLIEGSDFYISIKWLHVSKEAIPIRCFCQLGQSRLLFKAICNICTDIA